MRLAVSAVCLAALLAACGDNSKLCGPGTLDRGGVCEPDVTELVCGEGTVLDASGTMCVPDVTSCPDGKVLVNGVCIDPPVTIDLMEGPEPNGFETNATPAGTITVTAIDDDGYGIKGCIRPTANDAPDYDVYRITALAPMLLEVSATGSGGLVGGFYATSDVGGMLAAWERFGIAAEGATASRQLYLPVAGDYRIVVTDSRTLIADLESNGASQPAAGNPDGTSCYIVTLANAPIAPATLDLANGAMGPDLAGEVKLYTAAFGTAQQRLTGRLLAEQALPSIVVVVNDAVVELADGTPDAQAIFSGVQAGDEVVVALDHVYEYAVLPVAYDLDVQ